WQGTENANADFPGATSIFQGIARTLEEGGGKASSSADGAKPPRPDVAIVVFGEDPYAEWFGDLKSIDYRGAGGAELALLEKLRQESVPRVCVFLTGRPLWIEPELAAC